MDKKLSKHKDISLWIQCINLINIVISSIYGNSSNNLKVNCKIYNITFI